MRELTKSFFSFSWAMSLFGLQQAVNVINPSRATQSFKSVTKATEDEFGGITEATFRAGDSVQRSFVDLTFGVFNGQAFNPGNWMKSITDALQGAVGSFAQSGSAAPPGGQSSSSTGWGPVPAPPGVTGKSDK